jgi:hypothetical protein
MNSKGSAFIGGAFLFATPARRIHSGGITNPAKNCEQKENNFP